MGLLAVRGLGVGGVGMCDGEGAAGVVATVVIVADLCCGCFVPSLLAAARFHVASAVAVFNTIVHSDTAVGRAVESQHVG